MPLGIEALPPGEAEPLLEAYHDGVAALPSAFGAWAAIGLAAPDPAALARLLDRGFAGACVAADALAGPEGFDRLGPVLETLERRGAPLLVHPGPAAAPARAAGLVAGADATTWPTMQAAWHAFAVWGRPAHPRCGCASRCSPGWLRCSVSGSSRAAAPRRGDPDVFLDVSSYGTRAVDAVLREVGVDRLVHGTDRPVGPPAELPLGDAVRRRAARAQPVPPAPDHAGRRMTALAPRHDLRSSDELRALVAQIAAEPERWQPLVRHGTADRAFEQLWRDEHVDVWVISWATATTRGSTTTTSPRGAVAVVEGEVIEERLVLGGAPLRAAAIRAGDAFDFDASHVHRMRQDTDVPAVSIHAYSPPLWRMGPTSVAPDGTLRRQSISYAEELRPAEAA